MAREGLPDFGADPGIRERVDQLKEEAMVIIEAIRKLGEKMGSEDPLLDPKVLARAVREGILDAMGLSGSGVAPGKIDIRFEDGKVDAVDERGRVLRERERLAPFL